MTFEQLRYFITVSNTLNFSAAAEELYISQSSLSKSIKSLEQECQVKLFERDTRNIHLTDAGHQMVAYVNRLLTHHNEMMGMLREHSCKNKKTLTMYSIPVTLTYGVNDMILQFERQHPQTNIRVIDADAQYVARALRSKKADIILIRTRNLDTRGLEVYPIIDDELVLMVNRNHPLAKRQEVNLRDTSNEYFYLLGKSTYMYQICIDECLKCGFYPNNVNSLMRLETIRSFVVQGSGISLLMKQVARNLLTPDIVIISLKEKPVLSLALVVRANEMDKECHRFIEFAVRYFQAQRPHTGLDISTRQSG